jgi:hypothetical protein
MGGHELLPAGYVAAETVDRGDELADGVLPRDGVVQDRGVHCPSALAARTPVSVMTSAMAAMSDARFGDVANRCRQCVSMLGWNAVSPSP